jgi:PAS domain S-box-containing protein
MDANDYQIIRQLFDDYLRMYSSRDDRLTTYFSEDFSGFTGGGDFLVKNREEWVAITRQDFAQVKDPIRIELKDLAIQVLAETIAVATGFLTIHLPIEDHILSKETARLVLIFHLETAGWKISHSSISIPYHLVREGEIYPMKELVDRNLFLEKLVAERTNQLSEANDNLQQTNEKLAREIAEHQQTEAALKNSLSLLEASLESTADGILIVDSQGKIAQWNRKFVEMWMIPQQLLFGRDDEKVIDSIVSQIVDPGLFIDNVRRLYEQPEQSSFDRIEFFDGRIFERYSQPQRIKDAIVGRVWSFRDITARTQAAEEKAKLEAVNRQFQKTESLSCMAGAIAHHFNNQLGVVIGGLEMAISDLPRDAKNFKMLTAAKQGADKAVQVSRLMLTYLGQTTGKHTPQDLSEICRQSLPLLQAAIPKETIFLTDLPSPGPTISANANQIQQALTNLITNAWEAGDNNPGDIRLTVRTVSPTDISAIHHFPIDFHSQDLPYACLEITDVGCGIADEDIEKIFDPFFSSKFPGRGLGLPTVLGIVKSHSGVVTVHSKIRQGSTFRVYFPVFGKEIALQPLDTKVQPLSKEGVGTVLLVEDEEMVRNMAETMLTTLGSKVLLAKDGIEAVEVFKRYKDEIGVVLCDLSMPRMNGWETLSALRRIRPDIPVVIVSGYDESKTSNDNYSEHAHIFLHKPYQMAELKDAVTRAMRGD